MIEKDGPRVNRLFDLKGSEYKREVKLDLEKIKSSGMKCLKDKNLIAIN